MRLPRVRFTICRLMLVVALAAFALGGGMWGYRMWRLSRYDAGCAQTSIDEENRCLHFAVLYTRTSHRADEAVRILARGRAHEVAAKAPAHLVRLHDPMSDPGLRLTRLSLFGLNVGRIYQNLR
jgi:hypothetical protein